MRPLWFTNRDESLGVCGNDWGENFNLIFTTVKDWMGEIGDKRREKER